MFTRCPECLTVHALNASALANAAGAVCCGKCQQDFSALDHLFDYWPDTDSTAPGVITDGSPTVLGAVEAGSENKAAPDLDQASEEQASKESDRAAWLTIIVLLLFITVSNLAWTFREPLMSRPEVRSFLVDIGVMEPRAIEPFRDTTRFHLVSRDMHQHPARAGVLTLSVTFVNRAGQNQPYPSIELTLTDAGNQPLARREFAPSDYLPAGTRLSAGLAPDVHVPVLIEFADPGVNAAGFELSFH